jgi:hypothetical protein
LDVWKWQIPLRIKLFSWLLFENKILTWDNLSKRGFCGPSRCVLCGEEEESINHLMVYCSFSKDVWEFILNVFQIQRVWGCGQLNECFQVWVKEMEMWKELSLFHLLGTLAT